MFNALNRFIARLDGDNPAAAREASDHGTFGFQVLRNTNLALAVEPWFDFIVGINGRVIDDSDPFLFAQEVRNCAGGNVTLGLWSAKGQRTRTLHIPVPAANAAPVGDGNDAADTAAAASLGLSLQWTPLAVVSNIWHVLDVPARSPAEAAGLLPYSDYILGTPEGVLHGEGGLGELVEDHIGRPLRLWVYNNEYDVTREVVIQPSRDWGGEGALGCVLGYGALHRLPAPLSEPVNGPGETMFDGDSEKQHVHAAATTTTTTAGDLFEQAATTPTAATFAGAGAGAGTGPGATDTRTAPLSNNFLVPAQLASPPPAAAAGGGVGAPPRSKKKDRAAHHHTATAGLSMDDYFKEEEQKSQQLDNAPSRHSTPVAPPPKGPPRAVTPRDGGGDSGEAGGGKNAEKSAEA
ncbi:golgi reassembly stacking protein [Niveomyces insectorum RCEF 264]|uniref:Golgi reassembly stacking protein n=1 Tax=Niveomyces insectorum RCEF 264 TaxID=1081102 RepID=A0A167VHJ0_9HYPO|nr:golgi reassembly stacking protein [Niveomyces insectorum RCEF 264]